MTVIPGQIARLAWRSAFGSNVSAVGRFSQARQSLITADGGGRNGSRCRFRKVSLQAPADELGLQLQVTTEGA